MAIIALTLDVALTHVYSRCKILGTADLSFFSFCKVTERKIYVQKVIESSYKIKRNL